MAQPVDYDKERAEIESRAGAAASAGGDPNALARQVTEAIHFLKLVALASAGGSLPVTFIGPIMPGTDIGTTDRYIELWRNSTGRLVAVRVTAEFVIPGQKLSLSLTTDLSNQGRVSLLTSAGPVISDPIWLRPDQSLYANTADVFFTLNGATVRTYVFDPLSFRDDMGGL